MSNRHSTQQTCIASSELTDKEKQKELNHMAKFFADEYTKRKGGYICWRLFVPKAASFYNGILNTQ